MKFSRTVLEFDATDQAILDLLQENCKQPLAAIGEKVGLSAPSVVERIHKLEEAGVTAIFPPGTVAAEAAEKLLDELNSRLGYAQRAAIAKLEVLGEKSRGRGVTHAEIKGWIDKGRR